MQSPIAWLGGGIGQQTGLGQSWINRQIDYVMAVLFWWSLGGLIGIFCEPAMCGLFHALLSRQFLGNPFRDQIR